jgi:acyl dehydratase
MASTFQVRAVNTAVDSENRIHHDQVAAAYGFSGGLVPGVTVYGYMASAVIEYLGPEWLERGEMDVRFFQPFYEGEQVAISMTEVGDGRIKVEAGTRASGTAWLDRTPQTADYPPAHSMPDRQIASPDTMRTGAVLGTLEKALDLSLPGMSAPLDASIAECAHPAILLSLANEILIANFILGPWIHSASEVRNSGPARHGEKVQVRGKIVDAYERKGHELVVLDVAILSGERLVSRIRHTAIWQLRRPQ